VTNLGLKKFFMHPCLTQQSHASHASRIAHLVTVWQRPKKYLILYNVASDNPCHISLFSHFWKTPKVVPGFVPGAGTRISRCRTGPKLSVTFRACAMLCNITQAPKKKSVEILMGKISMQLFNVNILNRAQGGGGTRIPDLG
jgi:hypothetical protein